MLLERRERRDLFQRSVRQGAFHAPQGVVGESETVEIGGRACACSVAFVVLFRVLYINTQQRRDYRYIHV